MNQFKTFIFLFTGALFLWGTTVQSALDRDLKPNEIDALKSNIQKNPGNIKSRLFLGHHYYRTQEWQEVVNYLSPITESLPKDSIYELAMSYNQMGHFRDAESLANILLSKNNVKTKHYLLAVKILSGILDTAKFDPYIIKDKKNKKEIKRIDLKKPIINSLFDTLKMAKSKDSTNSEIYEVWLEMVELYVEHYAFDGLRVIEDMKKNNVELTPNILSMQCKYHFLAEFTKQAKESCQKAIDKDPSNPRNYIYLGQVHVDTGEEKVGKRMLASVGKRFSSSEEALWATADSYLQGKNLTAAYTYFKKASEHPDAQARDYLGLGKTAFELKKYNEALNAFVQHCQISGVYHQEFRKASGLLKENMRMQDKYRQKMMDCKPKSRY